jgi:hypothetical protein
VVMVVVVLGIAIPNCHPGCLSAAAGPRHRGSSAQQAYAAVATGAALLGPPVVCLGDPGRAAAAGTVRCPAQSSEAQAARWVSTAQLLGFQHGWLLATAWPPRGDWQEYKTWKDTARRQPAPCTAHCPAMTRCVLKRCAHAAVVNSRRRPRRDNNSTTARCCWQAAPIQPLLTSD